MSNKIQLVEVEQMKSRTPTKGTKFGKFTTGLETTGITEFVKTKIVESKDNTVRVRAFDIMRELGIWRTPQTIYKSVKYAMSMENIHVATKTQRNGDMIFEMRPVYSIPVLIFLD